MLPFTPPLLLLAGCTSEHSSFLDPQGPVAAAQRWHLFEVVALVMIVVLPVLVLTPLIAWRYRRRNERSRYTPKWDFSWPLEVAIWGIPIAIVAVLAVLLWRSTHALDPYAPLRADTPPLRVQVVGLDWKWLFIYPEERIASVGELAFPADRPLALELTSDSVMQSFFIPALGSQIYAMAGMVTKLHLEADGPGRFEGENTQFNGMGFQKQKFAAVAMPPGDFKAWVKTVRANGIALDQAIYRKLARKSTPGKAYEELGTAAMPQDILYFNKVPSALFTTIVDKYRYGQADEANRQTRASTNDAALAALRPVTRQEARQ
ncbi:MAG: cytochrome ubiquinol oxidase subunit II [Gammaproteobacteria bacterium]|jgi:cytochrome o ubiquinol oxidase subunit 2